jgi:hypothetical protein
MPHLHITTADSSGQIALQCCCSLTLSITDALANAATNGMIMHSGKTALAQLQINLTVYAAGYQ